MNEDVENVLKSMEGKDVNIYINGKLVKYFCMENFSWWMQEIFNGDEYLVLSEQNSEERFSILMDEIYDTKIEKDGNEIIFILNEVGTLQCWVDVIE